MEGENTCEPQPQTLSLLSIALSGCSKRENQPVGPNQQNQTTIEGYIDGVLTFNDSPYNVAKDLIVDSSKTLSVEAGVRLFFADSAQLLVYGNILCLGNVSQPILFSSAQNHWGGIKIEKSTSESLFQYVIIENVDLISSEIENRDGALDILKADAVIRNSIFRNNKANNGGAISVDQSRVVMANNIVMDNYAGGFGGAMISSSSSNKIINNTFYRNIGFNYAGGLLIVSPVMDEVQNNIFYMNTNNAGDPRIAFLGADTSNYVVQFNFLPSGNSPSFVSATDLHLAFDSPCINAGNPASSYNDVDGTRNDQGAYGGPIGNW